MATEEPSVKRDAETGKYDPSLPLAFKIARLFRCSIEDVFEPDDDGTA